MADRAIRRGRRGRDPRRCSRVRICIPIPRPHPQSVRRVSSSRAMLLGSGAVSENAYLVGLRLAGKKVVMIGGGTVAQRRVPVLIRSGARCPRHRPGGHPGGGSPRRAAAGNHPDPAGLPRRRPRRRLVRHRRHRRPRGQRRGGGRSREPTHLLRPCRCRPRRHRRHPGLLRLRGTDGRGAGRRRAPPLGGGALSDPGGVRPGPHRTGHRRRRPPPMWCPAGWRSSAGDRATRS